MASDLAAPTNIFVFTKLHKVLEVLAKQCQLARVACSRLDTPHEGDPGTAVDLYQVAARLGASPRECKFRTCEDFARALRTAVKEGPSTREVGIATETLLRDKLPRAIKAQPQEVMQELARVVEQLLADKEFKSNFGSPPTDAIARGYSQAVRHPVGLIPILARLRRRGGYALASEAALDLRRIGSNCLTFNVHNGIKAAAPAVNELRRLALRYLDALDVKLAAFVDSKRFALADSSWVSGKHEGGDVARVRKQLVEALETIVDGAGMTSFVWPLDNTDFFSRYKGHAAAVGVLGRPVALLEAIEDLHCRLLPSLPGAFALILAPFQTGATVWRALGDAGVASSCEAELERALQILAARLHIPVKELQDQARRSVGLVPVHRSRPFQLVGGGGVNATPRQTPSPAVSTPSATGRRRMPNPATAARTKSGTSARSGSSGRPPATMAVTGISAQSLSSLPIVSSAPPASMPSAAVRGMVSSTFGAAYQHAGLHYPVPATSSHAQGAYPPSIPMAPVPLPPTVAAAVPPSPGGAGDDDDDDYDEDLEALGLKDVEDTPAAPPARVAAAAMALPAHLLPQQRHLPVSGQASTAYQPRHPSKGPDMPPLPPPPTPTEAPPARGHTVPRHAAPDLSQRAAPVSRPYSVPPSSASATAADASSAASPAELAPQHKRRHSEQVGKSVHLDAVAKANRKAVLGMLKKLEAAKAPVRLGPNAGQLIQPASIFLAPVESTPEFASDYYVKIRKPMDLGTIRCKVVHNEYCLVQDLVSDVRLMLANCRTFNKGNEDVLFFADELGKAFENLTKSMKQFQQSGTSFLNPAASHKGTGKPSRFFKYPAAAKGYVQALARTKEAGGGAKHSSSGSRAGSALSAPRSAAQHSQSPMPPPQLIESGPPIAAMGPAAVPVSIRTKVPSSAHRTPQATPRQASGGESVSLSLSGARRGASTTPSASGGPRIAISFHRQSSAGSVASSQTGTHRSSAAQQSRKRLRDDASSVASGSSSKRAAIPLRSRPSSSASAKPDMPDPISGPLTDLMRRACMRVLTALDKEPVAASIINETFESRPKSMAAALRRPELESPLLAAHKAGRAVHEKSCEVIGELTLPILKARLVDKGSRLSSSRFLTAQQFQAFASRMTRSVVALYSSKEAKEAVAGNPQGEEIVLHLANQSRRVYWLFTYLWAEHALVEAVRVLRRHGAKYPVDEPECSAKAVPLMAQVTKLRAEREHQVGELNLWHQEDAIAILSRHIGYERTMKRHSEVMWAFSDKFSRLFPTVDWPNYESIVGSKPTDLPSVRDRLTFLRRTSHPPLSGLVAVRDILAETRRVFANCKKFNANQQHMDLEPPTVNFWKLADRASQLAENELGLATVELWWIRDSLPKHTTLLAKAKAEAGAREEAERLRAENLAARSAARPAPVAPKAKVKPVKAPEETLSGLRQATLGNARDLLEGVTRSALWPRSVQSLHHSDSGNESGMDVGVAEALWGAGDGWHDAAPAERAPLATASASDPEDDLEEDLAWAAGAMAAPVQFGAAGMFASSAEVPAQSAAASSEVPEDTPGAGWSVPLSDEQAAALKQVAAGAGFLACEECGDNRWLVSVRPLAPSSSSSSSSSPAASTVPILHLDAGVHAAMDKTVGRAFTSSLPAAASAMGDLAWSSEAEAARATADAIRVPSLAVLKATAVPGVSRGSWAAEASLVSRTLPGSPLRPALMLRLALRRGGESPAGEASSGNECMVSVGPAAKSWRIEPGWAATIEGLRSGTKARPLSSAQAFGAPDSDARVVAKAAMDCHLASLAADGAVVWGGAASDRLLEPGSCIVVPLA